MSSQGWLPFADAGSHFDILHRQHDQRVAVCTTTEGRDWQQRVYEHDTARSMAGNLAPDYETYLSQSGLGRRRTVADVKVLTGHWADLDVYGTEFANHSADELLALIQQQHPWLPSPTMIVSSGRGYHFQWVFLKPVLASECLHRWQATQDTITDILAPWGADPAVRDAARVLRLVGSVNEKNGALVTAVLDSGAGVDFDKFAKCVQRNQPKPMQSQKRDASAPPPRKYTTTEAAGRAKLNGYRLAVDRMRDYVTLAELRGAPLQDCRSRLLFAYACSGAWFWASREHATYELNQFSRDYFAGHKAYGAKRCQTILDRMGQAKSGVVQLWKGTGVDPRYRLRNARIIRELEISPAEQEQMKTIISTAEKARRRRVRLGRVTRNEYLSAMQKRSQERLQEAADLKSQGYKQAQIARMMGLSASMVSRLLKRKNRK